MSSSSKLHYILPKRDEDPQTILLAEQDASLRVPLAERLRMAGYKVIEIATPWDFIEEVSELASGGHWCDTLPIIIADVRMSGISTIEALGDQHDRVPTVILISDAPDTAETRRRARLVGAAAVLGKPISPADAAATCLRVMTPLYRAAS